MVAVGNHEYDFEGQNFKPDWSDFGNDSGGECGVILNKKFLMPSGGNQNLWYSFDYTNVHVVVMSTENDFSPNSTQQNWLRNDLQQVNRKITPWVIFTGHRPMYTSYVDDDLDTFAVNFQALVEPLLFEGKVDLAIWGHVHNYERSCPVYQSVCSADGSAPVHVIVGTGGADLDNDDDDWWPIQPDWVRKRLQTYGFLELDITATTLHGQFREAPSQTITDTFILTK